MSSEKNKRVPALKTHDEMVAEWMNDPAFKAEYDALEEEFRYYEILKYWKERKLMRAILC